MPFDISKPLFIAATTASSMAAGGFLYTSLITVPSMVESAPSAKALALNWRGVFQRGVRIAPAMNVFSALAFFGCAYVHHHPQLPERTRNFVLAGISALGFAPWTILAMGSTNNSLLEKAEGYSQDKLDEAQAPEVRKQVTSWGNLNLVRAFLPLAATIFGFQAL